MYRKKILIVDDEPDFVEMLKMRLEANNYEVVSASDGEEGLKKAKEEQPNLILLDIMMPRVDGTTMAQNLKLNPETKDTPVIFLTCLFQKDEEKNMGHLIKGNLLMAKPFDAQELLTMIEKVV